MICVFERGKGIYSVSNEDGCCMNIPKNTAGEVMLGQIGDSAGDAVTCTCPSLACTAQLPRFQIFQCR